MFVLPTFFTLIGLTSISVNAEEVLDIPEFLMDTNEDEPEMSLSEVIQSGTTEAILTEVDIPEIARELNKVADTSYPSFRAVGYWKYKYTAEPYAFYQHTSTKKWKVVQVTSTMNHLVNTMIGGWVGAPAWNVSYNPPRR